MPAHAGKRLLLLCTTTGYQTRAFVQSAEKLGVSIVFGTDRCHVLDDPWRDGAIPLRFEDAEASAAKLMEYAASHPIHGVVALGDRPGPTAGLLAEALRLAAHPRTAADICRDKYLSREVLRQAGMKVPEYQRFSVEEDPKQILSSSALKVGFPCVLKPLSLSGSRGVIRANTDQEFTAAFLRIRALLRSGEIGALREDSSNFIQVESYIEGKEVAVEGLVDRGRLHVLAIFDKPDPLDGPFFEETIYVTPSRLPAVTQTAIKNTVEQAVRALGLFDGPLHAEMRVNEAGVWPLEIAARPIGGLCARTLRFQENMSLEELILRHALGEKIVPVREARAAGVMMIPIPQAGFLEEVKNVREAAETPGVEAIEITAKVREKLVPLPEGSSYLGFIFARGESPEIVEAALRLAHEKLQFVISPSLPVV
ncbi:MAG TPA: ATP-grasp domain-containing protein [Terriglobales bacterium]|nr:ATP-grasp domain-containing protein [Terriglobales bacterium]